MSCSCDCWSWIVLLLYILIHFWRSSGTCACLCLLEQKFTEASGSEWLRISGIPQIKMDLHFIQRSFTSSSSIFFYKKFSKDSFFMPLYYLLFWDTTSFSLYYLVSEWWTTTCLSVISVDFCNLSPINGLIFFGNLIFLVLITLNQMFLILSVLCQNSSSIFWKSYANAWKTCSKKFQFVQRWNLILISVVSEDLRRSIGSNFHFLICRKSQQLHMRAILINLPLMLLVIQARLLLLVDILHGIENMVADYLPKVTQLQWTVAIFLLCLKVSVLDCAGCCHRQCHSFSSVSSCMYVSISSHS